MASMNDALQHSGDALGVQISATWLATYEISPGDCSAIDGYDGVWIAPGSPYKSLEGALWGIELARSSGRPLLGTCAGFQHLILEHARNVVGLREAASEQYAPDGSDLVIHRLECVVRGKELRIALESGSRVAELYGASSATERYYCSFGLNPSYRRMLFSGGLRPTGVDTVTGEIRVIEGTDSSFYLGTLFVPQVRSSAREPHPVITGFLRAATSFAISFGKRAAPST